MSSHWRLLQLYIRDATAANPYALLLFGGEIGVQHEQVRPCFGSSDHSNPSVFSDLSVLFDLSGHNHRRRLDHVLSCCAYCRPRQVDPVSCLSHDRFLWPHSSVCCSITRYALTDWHRLLCLCSAELDLLLRRKIARPSLDITNSAVIGAIVQLLVAP